ncbi:MAG: transcriptional regulator [Chloroflexi bacterium]|nr:MAG: transcriptional regulator [Chloroflexota bacterium]
MKASDIVLTPIPQADGQMKNRPALLLCKMPPFDDALVCGISTQLRHEVVGFDELIVQQDDDFTGSGLVADSLIRLGFLAVIPQSRLMGSIGAVGLNRHKRLLKNLSEHLLMGAEQR